MLTDDITNYGDELIPLDLIPQSDDNGVLAVATASGFLPRLQLYGGNSDACKEGKIGIGRWGLVRGDSIEDLGPTVDVLVCAGRAKAVRIAGETIISSFDHQSEEFKAIQADSDVEDSGCMYGPEFLVYVPSAGVFATYFMQSKTARKEAKGVHALLRKAATLKAKLISTKKYKWHGPEVAPCSTPFQMPDLAILKSEIEKFQNQKASGPAETVEAADERAR